MKNKCYDEGAWQTYLDGEQTSDTEATMTEHVKTCSTCAEKLASVKENSLFSFDKIAIYAQALGESHTKKVPHLKNPKGVFTMFSKYKKIAVAAGLIIAIGCSFSYAPVRAVAQEFLTLFRVENVQTIAINPQDLNKIQQAFNGMEGKLDIKNFGSITSNGFGPSEGNITLEQAKAKSDIPVLMPEYMPLNYKEINIDVRPGGTVNFTLDVNKTNDLITALGGKELLPQELNKQTFSLSVSDSLSLSLRNTKKGEAYQQVSILRTKSPVIKAPKGTNISDIRKALLSLPVIPENIRQQLAAIEDWQSTLVIPATNDRQVNTINIDGVSGIFVSNKESQNNNVVIKMSSNGSTTSMKQMRREHGFILWQKDGIITVVDGNLDFEELKKVAESLR